MRTKSIRTWSSLTMLGYPNYSRPAYSKEVAMRASTTDVVQVFDGTGYMVETGIAKLMRDARGRG